MRTYRISPSLLNSFSGWLNCSETYAKYWGNSEAPAMSEEEYEEKCKAELLAYINREPQPRNEAADRGTCLNEIVDRLIGAEPSSVADCDKLDGYYLARRNGFEFKFDSRLVEEVACAMRNGIPQFHLSNTYLPEGCDYAIELHGFSDYIFPSQIWDLKTTGKYESEKYANNWQRHVYPVIAADSGAVLTCERFGFYVAECYETKSGLTTGRTWVETYDVNLEQSRAEIMEFITGVVVPQLDAWLVEGLTPNQAIRRESDE